MEKDWIYQTRSLIHCSEVNFQTFKFTQCRARQTSPIPHVAAGTGHCSLCPSLGSASDMPCTERHPYVQNDAHSLLPLPRSCLHTAYSIIRTNSPTKDVTSRCR